MDEAELKQAAVLLCEHFGVRKPGMAALIVGQAKEFARSQREALEAQVKSLTAERDAQAEAVRDVLPAFNTTRTHVWTETPGIEVQTFPDPEVPHSLRLAVRDVHAREDLASVRIEAFRLDLLCGPIARLWIEHQSRIARAAVEGGKP